MKATNFALPLETLIGRELFDRLEGDLIEMILKEAKVEHLEDEWKMILEGNSYRISNELTPEIYNLCMEVQHKLQYEKPIDYYISNSSDFNAFAIPASEEGSNDVINLNSTLVERLANEELRFVIGHEIGHLASDNARITRLIRFVFPNYEKIPMILMNKISLWEKLSELTADRYGFIASGDFGTCLNGFFKLSSGLNVERLNIQQNALLEENEKRIEYFKTGKGLNITTHPINLIRIKALQLFSNSKLFEQIKAGTSEIKADEEFSKSIDELVQILLVMSSSEIDYHRKFFIASAGILLATLDKEMDPEELRVLLSALSGYTIFPETLVEDLIEKKRVEEVFIQSMSKILEINPGERKAMIDFLLDAVIADHELGPTEIEFVFQVGQKSMGFARKEVAQIIAQKIRAEFIPQMF